MSLPEIQVERGFGSVTVTINGLLHVHFPVDKYAGLQSWYTDDRKRFVIEYAIDGGALITTEYDQREVWEAILGGLARVFSHG